MAEQSLGELDFVSLTDREFFPSPVAWEEQVLYFLMLDRFSDNREKDYIGNDGNIVTTGSTPAFAQSDARNAPRQEWVEAGNRFCGGNLLGLTSKIGYLKRLGISAIWISPIFKQIAAKETYHGYGIQHFLDVDPRFGTRDDLKKLVETAHASGIRIILDIILNHTGDVFGYDPDRYRTLRDDGSTFSRSEVGRARISRGRIPGRKWQRSFAVWSRRSRQSSFCISRRSGLAEGISSCSHLHQKRADQQFRSRPGVSRGRFLRLKKRAPGGR